MADQVAPTNGPIDADCRLAIDDAEKQDQIKWSRLIISPILIVASAGALTTPVLAGNAGLNTMDHIEASEISQACGGETVSNAQIAGEVLGDIGISFVTNGIEIFPEQATTE